MMSLLLYGIIADDDTPLVIESTMRLIKAKGLAAIVTVCEAEISREPALVLAFGDQVMHIHQQTTVIPMRYGSVLVDDGEVINHLHEHQVHYQKHLAELDNCEEMGVRITLNLTAENDVIAKPLQVSGYSYLLARKRAYAIPEKAEQQAILINNALAGLYRQHCAALSVFNGQDTYLLSYLVPRTGLPEFRERLNALAESITDPGFISGPWPPYNFAS